MDFMEMMKNNQKKETENGAIGYATQGHKLVDLNFAIPSFREKVDTLLFDEALEEDKLLTLKWLLYLRDIRFGVGERKAFREFLVHLAKKDEELVADFIRNVPIEEYGRWDDYVEILDSVSYTIQKAIMIKLAVQLGKDDAYCEMGKKVSLLAKWLPSENASSARTRKLAKFVRQSFGMTSKEYRKILSRLRKYIDVVECKMSSNNWDKIDYEKVPSKANLLYFNAFMKHDETRRMEYIDSLKEGKSKINSNALFLHDIVHKYTGNSDSSCTYKVFDYNETLEQMWNAQDKVKGFKNTIVVRDGSYSMTCSFDRYGSTSAIDVANAITLYCAENNTGKFKNKFITFSARPVIVDVSKYVTLHDKLKYMISKDDMSNTNIKSVFDLILNTAIKNNVSNNDLPKNILIISDMEFDMIIPYWGSSNEALFDNLFEKFMNAGYEMPKLIFWNVRSRTNTIPIQENKNGVILLSGFSKNLMRMVMSSELDPYKALVKELSRDRYSIIDKLNI